LVTYSYFKLFIVTMVDVVKINEDLLKRIKRLIKDKSMKIKYSNIKQFINIAVLDKLNEEERRVKDG